MDKATIKAAIEDAQEFIRRARAVLDEKAEPGYYGCGTAKSGALRRQSLELTRALARMRNP